MLHWGYYNKLPQTMQLKPQTLVPPGPGAGSPRSQCGMEGPHEATPGQVDAISFLCPHVIDPLLCLCPHLLFL